MYKKRAGTSGVRGHLYETKLLSLLLFRAQHNDNVEQIYLGTNLDEIGAFDDICFKAKIKGLSRDIAVFIQAKHRENENKTVILNNKNNLPKYFESFLKIKQKFDLKSNDKMFNGIYEDTDCVFVLYTTEHGDFADNFDGSAGDILNDLISTGDLGSRPVYTDEDVNLLCKIAMREEIKMLAARFCKYIYQKNKDMNDELISRYHVVLAKHVIHVSDIQPNGYRIGRFRPFFFSRMGISDLMLFQDYFFAEILKRHANKNKDNLPDDKTIQELLSAFFTDPSDFNLSYLVFNNIAMYKNGRFEFSNGLFASSYHKLKKLNLPRSTIDQAITKTVILILEEPFQFQLPAAFGNKDVMLKGEKRKVHLVKKLLDLIDKSSPSKIITIDESNTDSGFLHINGGIGSAVGNVLIYDENTRLYRFSDNIALLEKNSKLILHELTSKITNLEEYRLSIRIKNFPRLSFDYNNEDLVIEFFNKFIFFANQEDETGVGNILKQEIDDHECTDAKNFRVKTDAIFLNFHEEIQQWWMKQNRVEYLTEACRLYEKAKSNILDNPMTSVISMMYMSEIRAAECIFGENPRVSLKSVDLNSRTIIVTDITKLTFVKLIQCLDMKNYIVIDLKYMINLPISDFRTCITELKTFKKERHVIIVCDGLKNSSTLQRSLQEIGRAFHNKNITIIINKSFLDVIMKHFPQTNLINDEGNSLLDLDHDSRINIMRNTKTIFQGKEVNLDSIIDDDAVAVIKGVVLNKILLNEIIRIGESLAFPKRPYELLSYDETRLQYVINDLYIDREVRCSFGSSKVLQSLHDLNDDIVLITAKPGMGKSTLLSYLSIKTKEVNTKIWLMRINLLDYSKDFSDWKNNETIIDTLDVLRFVCQIILKNKRRKLDKLTISFTIVDGEVCLNDPIDDEWVTFELEMFLHFLNKDEIIFLIDGFDEICPNYEDEVLSFLNVIRNFPRKHKLWITSRPYNKIKTILQKSFGITDPYELEPFSETDQEIYFHKFWKYNLRLNELSPTHLENIKAFIAFIIGNRENVFSENFSRFFKPQNFLMNNLYLNFIDYLENEMRLLLMAFPLIWYHENTLNYCFRLTSHVQNRFRLHVKEKGITDIVEFVGTPLHLYLVANYFLTMIKDGSSKQWDLDINTYSLYESFLETKLKHIRFQDKNKMDIDNPDVLETYEIVRKKFIDMHKKLAAYAIYQNNGLKIFTKEGLEEINLMINQIINGREKTGLIYSVSNNVPQFIHMTFAEYFAVEYICDLVKNEKSNIKQQEILGFMLDNMLFECPDNVLNILDQKLKLDTEINLIVKNNNDYIFHLLMARDTKSPLSEVMLKNLNNILIIFMSTIESKINGDNLDVFMKVVAKAEFLKVAARLRYEDLIMTVLTIVRKIDILKWRVILSNPDYYCDDIIMNSELRSLLRRHVLSYYEEFNQLDSTVPNTAVA